jgi:IPT/TIG domain
MRALRSWLDRLDGVDQSFDPAHLAVLRAAVLGPTLATPEELVQLSTELDEIRQRVAAEQTAEQAASSRYRLLNLGTGALAGGLAAASGVVGVAKGSLDLIALLAFLSAFFTAILTTLKPAERENESKLRADALGQLAAAIDLFDIDRPHDVRGLLLAVKEVHERLAIAEGRAKIVPLGASSKSTVGTAIISISQTEGPTSGGQNLTITGTGFTGATRVRFGANNAPSYQVVSDTQITATTPAHAAGSVKVTVVGPGGTSPDNALARYTYIAAPQSRLRKRRAGPQA